MVKEILIQYVVTTLHIFFNCRKLFKYIPARGKKQTLVEDYIDLNKNMLKWARTVTSVVNECSVCDVCRCVKNYKYVVMTDILSTSFQRSFYQKLSQQRCIHFFIQITLREIIHAVVFILKITRNYFYHILIPSNIIVTLRFAFSF